MSITQKIKACLQNKFMVGSLIAISLAGASCFFAVTSTKVASANFEVETNPETPKKTLLVSNSQNPADAIPYYNQGIEYYELGEYYQAIESYTYAIQINPNLAQAYNNRGIAYVTIGQYNQAISDLKIAAKLHYQQGNIKDSQKAEQLIGIIYAELNQQPNSTTNVKPKVERQMRNWCRNLNSRTGLVCY